MFVKSLGGNIKFYFSALTLKDLKYTMISAFGEKSEVLPQHLKILPKDFQKHGLQCLLADLQSRIHQKLQFFKHIAFR